MNLAQYDKWVIGNQKRILDWTKRYSKERFAPIRDAFTAYHRAKSNKQKIEAFENLKKELVSSKGITFEELVNNTFNPAKEDVQRAADKFTKGDIDALNRNNTNKTLSSNLKIYDDLSPLAESMKSMPGKIDNYDWVELDKAYRDNYNYDQMKALAEKYNVDYTDPVERNEFLKALSEMERKRLKEEAYTPHDVAGMITQIAYPVTLEHARKTDEFSPDAMLFDLGSQAFMAGGEGLGSSIAGRPGGIIGGMFTAPAVTEAGQVIVNDKPIEDAAADYGVGVGTNAFAPGAVKGMLGTFERPFIAGNNGAARQAANKFVDEWEKIVRMQRKGIPYRDISDLTKHTQDLFKRKVTTAIKSGEKWDSKVLMEESKKEALQSFLARQKNRVFKEGKTNVYKKGPIKTKELTPKEVTNVEDDIINITPGDRIKSQLTYRWKTPAPKEGAIENLAVKKINNEPFEATDLIDAGIVETPIHAATRVTGRYLDPLKSLGMNLGASTRLTDRKFGMVDRYLNLPWKYGEKEEREIDFSKPDVKTYMKAYKLYRDKPEYYKEPPKLKGYSEEELDKIRKAADIISINSVFGE